MNGRHEGVVDYALCSGYLGRLLRAKLTVPAEHLLLEGAPVIKRQNVKRLVKTASGHAVSLYFR